jgi:hypothetical protein
MTIACKRVVLPRPGGERIQCPEKRASSGRMNGSCSSNSWRSGVSPRYALTISRGDPLYSPRPNVVAGSPGSDPIVLVELPFEVFEQMQPLGLFRVKRD